MSHIVGILGCGWLGYPLAHALRKEKYLLNVSTASGHFSNKIDFFYYRIQLPDIVNKMFFDCHTLIILFPFRRSILGEAYIEMINVVRKNLSKRTRHIIFASSTMVYRSENKIVTEKSPLDTTERAKHLQLAEQALLRNSPVQTTVLRLGGLYGPKRPIGKFALLKGKIYADHPVNFIHLDDCVSIIKRLIQTPYHGILNAVCNEHPTRDALYKKHLTPTELQEVQFVYDTNTPYKIVTNDVLKKILNYQFIHSL